MSDDTPTQRFDTPAPAAPPEKKRSRLVPLLIIIGLVLVAVIVVLLIVLLGRNAATQTTALTSDTPSPTTSTPAPVVTPTPTPSQTQTHTNAPPPQPTGPAFTLFAPDLSKYSCSSGPYYSGPTPNVKVKWATVRTKSAWIVQGTSDAADSGFMQIPLSGNESNFPSPLDLACDPPSSTFTITIVGTNGVHVSKSWTVINDHPTG